MICCEIKNTNNRIFLLHPDRNKLKDLAFTAIIPLQISDGFSNNMEKYSACQSQLSVYRDHSNIITGGWGWRLGGGRQSNFDNSSNGACRFRQIPIKKLKWLK